MQVRLTTISAAAATTSTHSEGSKLAVRSPSPKNTADLSLCE
ncbi:hypothetical protein [Ruminococcus sp.]